MFDKTYYVYVLASHTKVLYVGMTNDLKRRVWEHKHGVTAGFTKKYQVMRLVYCENTHDVRAAIAREKQLKRWPRAWKVELIEKINPVWEDLARDWYGPDDTRQG